MLEVTPQGLQYAREFMPQFIQRLQAIQLRLGGSFLDGPEPLAARFGSGPALFEKHRVLDPSPHAGLVGEIIGTMRGTFPELAGVEIVDACGAHVDCTPDAVPVISAVPPVDGLYLAAGCSGHGFGLALEIGYLAADLITNAATSVDPAHFDLARLVDGSRIKVGSL
jgi:glycine/D-amino acid oxidase-like deaminating enzyme